MIYPDNFLQKLDCQQNKTIYAKVTSLSFDERPQETIEGRITSGSISLDGVSAVRRTCQISMVTQDINISDYYWSLNTKIKLSIGVENQIDNAYPNIIWFEQGVFIITSFNTSYSTNSYTINISGKDKMCLLNGEVAGSIGSSVDFGTMEQEYGDNVWKKIKLPVKDIIREMVHSYAGEPFHNIIINDLESCGLTLQEYRYDTPMFLFREVNSNVYSRGFIVDTIEVLWNEQPKTLKDLVESNFKFESLQEDFQMEIPHDVVIYPVTALPNIPQKEYTIAKIDYGETAGFTEGALVYPDDLVVNAGESITSILDKIKNFLGDFEYFYNLQGQFVFQKKKDYISTDWSPLQKDGDGKTYIEDLRAANGFSYIFNNSELFTSFANTPNLMNLKNDFSVWGTRKSATSTEVPIHMRYALDQKPIAYNTIEVEQSELTYYNKVNNMTLKGQTSTSYQAGDSYECIDDKSYICDWRELIYRMALDYNKYNHLDNFEMKVAAANPDLYPTGKTGYEQYYIDMQGFWRLLYNPFEDVPQLIQDLIKHEEKRDKIQQKIDSLDQQIAFETDWIQTYNEQIIEIQKNEEMTAEEKEAEIEVLQNEITACQETITELQNEKSKQAKEKSQVDRDIQDIENKNNTYYLWDKERLIIQESTFGWARALYEQPEQLIFWFDFMDTQGELEQFTVPVLGTRAKVTNDNQVKAIYYRETPNVIFQSGVAGTGTQTGYRYFQVPSALSMFSKSVQGRSAKESIDTLLYNHSYCIESISITSVPIYYLDVNTRIYVNDLESGIEGEYTISKISMQLTYNGTMNITATKAAQRLL